MEDTTPISGGVQSLHRALDLVETVAEHGGQMAIGELAVAAALPLPTIHRLLRTLVARGYMRQLPDRRYALGFRLVPLGVSASRLVGVDAAPILDRLVDELSETANLAVLSGDRAEYVAQSPSPHAMRMFTEVGRRVALHSTGVGKALLAQLPEQEAIALIRRTGLPAATPMTITDEPSLLQTLDRIRREALALDDEEQEIGVRCVAVPVPGALPVRLAVSISGPVTRMDDELVARAVPLLHQAGSELAESIPVQSAS